MKRIRISHVVVQPVLVWDDGEELSPGPQAEAVAVPLSALAGLGEKLAAEAAALTEQLDAG